MSRSAILESRCEAYKRAELGTHRRPQRAGESTRRATVGETWWIYHLKYGVLMGLKLQIYADIVICYIVDN